ncbi:MAG: hypothetical protein WBW84_04795 [Acidobacteriaceae bacterium]
MNSAKFILSPSILLSLACALIAGELISGTNLYFVSMVTIAFVSACLTYNLLGGLGTMSGIAFSRFALSTFIIAQFGKVILFEPADKNLDVPNLTITVYAIYFLSLMLGTFVFFRLRIRLPKPIEPITTTQSRYLYVIALIAGLVGVVGWTVIAHRGGAGSQDTMAHSYLRALQYFLPFSLVLAVDERITATDGRHSVGWRVGFPALTMLLEGFLTGSRGDFAEPFLIVFLTCSLRGYRFRVKHLVASIGLLVVFFLFVSPFYLYSRDYRVQPTLRQQFSTMVRLLESAPAQWSSIVNSLAEKELGGAGLVNYFDQSWALTLNRFALIGPDSTLIDACSQNYHYGFTSIEMDFLTGAPRFLVKNKPDYGSQPFLGHLDGQESDEILTSHSTITAISDSFGAFGFLGVMVFAFFIPPLIFVVYESIFDMRRPWGTVAAVLLLISFTEGSMGDQIVTTMIRQPIYLVVISLGAGWMFRTISAGGDRSRSFRLGDRPSRAES